MSVIKRYDCELPVIAVGHGETSETTSMVKAEHYDAAVAGRKMFRDALRKKRAEVERLRAELAHQVTLVDWWKDHLAVHLAILFGASGHAPGDADKCANDIIRRAERLVPQNS